MVSKLVGCMVGSAPGDRDMIGAMACAISGAYLGIEAIPGDWVDRLENREHIEGLARRLAERKG